MTCVRTPNANSQKQINLTPNQFQLERAGFENTIKKT